MPKRLTPSRIAAYERDGFVAPVDIMSASEAHDLRRRFEEAERRFPERLHSEQRNNAHYEFGFMDEIVHDGRILDAVEDLIGPDILLWSTVLFVKVALLVRGEDRFGHFRPGRRPLSDGEPEGVRFRDAANERFAQILYAGAEIRRAL